MPSARRHRWYAVGARSGIAAISHRLSPQSSGARMICQSPTTASFAYQPIESSAS